MRSILKFLVALPMVCNGQGNLIPNGSFEEIDDCPWSVNLIQLADPWLNDVGGVELYHTCSLESVGVPSNTTGYQHPHSGDGYAGIYTYGGPAEIEGREYLQVELVEPLQPSVKYIVSFHVSLADKFDYAIGSLGAYFSDTLLTRTSFNSLPGVESSVQSPDGQIFSNKDLWYLVTDTFVSRFGGERYMSIGNFKSTAESDTLFVPMNSPPRLKSYYYIDDVSVVEVDSVPNSVVDLGKKIFFNIYPNPNNGEMILEYHLNEKEAGQIMVYNSLGQSVFSQALNEGSTKMTIQLTGIAGGLYSVSVIKNGQLVRSEKMSILE